MPVHMDFLRSDLCNYKSASNLAFNNHIKELISQGRNIHHFGFGESPFPVPEPFKRGLIESAEKNEYLSVEGLLELRREILKFHSKYGDFDHFTVEDFVLGAGSKEVIYHIMNVFGGEGTIVTSGFSKWASLGGWRAGYALFPKELSKLREAVSSAGSHSYTCQPTPVQHALTLGLKHLDELDDYINRARKVLSLASHYCHRKLTSVGVVAHPGEGAYYFMPDFEVCRSPEIQNGEGLCELLLKEANVALQPCDPHYLRPRGELSTRFAFVNFKGRRSMEAVDVNKAYTDEEEEFFLKNYANSLVEGVEAVVNFVKNHKK